MRISEKDIEAAEMAYDHFVSDMEGGASEEFEQQVANLKLLLSRMKKAYRKQAAENA